MKTKKQAGARRGARDKRGVAERGLHPAACEHCCKLVSGEPGGLREFVREHIYVCGQALKLLCFYISMPFIAIAYILVLMFTPSHRRELAALKAEHHKHAGVGELPELSEDERRLLPEEEYWGSVARSKMMEALHREIHRLDLSMGCGHRTAQNFIRFKDMSRHLRQLQSDLARERRILFNQSRK
jgi:hypothetical protein